MNKILIIIPVYNEESSILKVMDSIASCQYNYDYIIVNDGSDDNSYGVCREKGLNVVNLPVNLGLGGAFQAGMKYAEERGYDYAVQIDGDGQHNVEFIERLRFHAEEYGDDITIGSRYLSERKPWNLRMIGSRIISTLILFTTKKRISDPTSGMRLYNKRSIRALAHRMNFGPEPDTLSFMMSNGYSVGETQVYMNERDAGESYLNGWESMKYMLRMCFSILLMKLI